MCMCRDAISSELYHVGDTVLQELRMAEGNKFDAVASRLNLAFDKSKHLFMEEAEDILRSTLSSPSRSQSSVSLCQTESKT